MYPTVSELDTCSCDVLSGRKSSQILFKLTLDNRKISFHYSFITIPVKKNGPPAATCPVIRKNKDDFSGFLALRDSKYLDSFPDSYLSGSVCNPKTFYTGFVT